jgi:hypothetical protein
VQQASRALEHPFLGGYQLLEETSPRRSARQGFAAYAFREATRRVGYIAVKILGVTRDVEAAKVAQLLLQFSQTRIYNYHEVIQLQIHVRDLKSFPGNGSAGSSPAPGTT